MSKSRLAPIRDQLLTIPRLELSAAVIACRLKIFILNEIKFVIKSVNFWCDSKIVINYINKEITNFGAHRVNEIRNNSNI